MAAADAAISTAPGRKVTLKGGTIADIKKAKYLIERKVQEGWLRMAREV